MYSLRVPYQKLVHPFCALPISLSPAHDSFLYSRLLHLFSLEMASQKVSPTASTSDIDKSGFSDAVVDVEKLDDGVPRQRLGKLWSFVHKLDKYGVEAARPRY